MKISGNIIDLVGKKIISGDLVIAEGHIREIIPGRRAEKRFILPGLVDSHVHVESSMLAPPGFARLAVRHGTLAVVADPHEIANVLGVEGVEYMIRCSRGLPIQFYYGAPSCVPATDLETSGARLNAEDVQRLMKRNDVHFLAEMMNYPGVLRGDPEVIGKIRSAQEQGKKTDGHAPGLRGGDLLRYIGAGISTDHENNDIGEAVEKISRGMKIMIREGSAARNLGTLLPLIDKYPGSVMFCTDDIHPDSLLRGHINAMVKAALAGGADLFHTLEAAIAVPVKHYGLKTGLLQEGDPADMIIVDNPGSFRVQASYLGGEMVFDGNRVVGEYSHTPPVNRFNARSITDEDLRVVSGTGKLRVIEAGDGELFTSEILVDPAVKDGMVVPDQERDILKLVVLNRYAPRPPAVAYIRGIGLKNAAMASSISHDCHNIIAVGSHDHLLAASVNAVVASRGGIALTAGKNTEILPLDLAGLMSTARPETVAEKYRVMEDLAIRSGSSLKAPFMTLSFMALLVIPELKLSDRGLFDGRKFEYVPLFTQ